MQEYVLYILICFIPIALLMIWILKKDGLGLKHTALIVAVSLAIILLFPICMSRFGASLTLLGYILILMILSGMFFRMREPQLGPNIFINGTLENYIELNVLNDEQMPGNYDYKIQPPVFHTPLEGEPAAMLSPETKQLHQLINDDEDDDKEYVPVPEPADSIEAESAGEILPHNAEVVEAGLMEAAAGFADESDGFFEIAEDAPARLDDTDIDEDHIDTDNIDTDNIDIDDVDIDKKEIVNADVQADADNIDVDTTELTEKVNDFTDIAAYNQAELFSLLDLGFTNKNSRLLNLAAQAFAKAYTMTNDNELRYLLLMELSSLYKDLGWYTQALEILGAYLEEENVFPDNDYITQVKYNYDYIKVLEEILNRMDMPNKPLPEVPRFIKIMTAENLQCNADSQLKPYLDADQ